MSNTKVSSEQIIDDVALGGNPTTTTQSAGNNTTRVATTAFVTTAVSNLVDSAPDSLNTLNELAAAMNDNASFFSTVLPLSGGTMTGNLGIGASASSVIGVLVSRSLANGLAAELSNTESSTGSGIVVKGGNNSSTYSADFRDYNNTTLMRIRGDGNVGIGTSSPSEKLSISPDTDVSAEIGKAHIGSVGHSDYAGFAHVDKNTTSDYALLQGAAGDTFLNASDGQRIKFRINNSEKATIDSSGNVGIGTSSPSSHLTLHGNMRFNTTNADGNEQRALFNVGGSADPFSITGYKADATTVGMVLNSGGVSYFNGGNVGIGTSSPADILHLVSDAPMLKTEATNDSSGFRIDVLGQSSGQAFRVLKDTTTTLFEVNTNGNILVDDGDLVVASGHGINFSATANTSATGGSTSQELLDDYEEGTWTATLSSSGGGFAASVTSFSGGHYTKIGNMVTAHIYTGSFNITNAGSGYAKIGGLPYASMYSAADYGSAIFYHSNCFAESSVTGYVSASADFTISTPTDQDVVGAVGWRVANTVYLMVQVQYMTPN